MKSTLEVIAFNIESCAAIEALGAHRIELCDNPGEGGTTPSAGMVNAARKKVEIELYPIIRPRGGDFLYSDDEFQIIKADIKICKDAGCDGVVIGMLTADGNIDVTRCKELVQLAYPMGVTFHRAFDRTNNLSKALEDVISIGCERILTSGGYPNAMDGAAKIAELIKQADERIVIMPGSGVRANNIAELKQKTGAVEFHTSGRMNIASGMSFASPTMNEKLNSIGVDEEEIKRILEQLA